MNVCVYVQQINYYYIPLIPFLLLSLLSAEMSPPTSFLLPDDYYIRRVKNAYLHENCLDYTSFE
jgi:hypothetical protein